MNCVIYKSGNKADTYLYVEKEGNFERVPENLLALLGELEKVMELELTPTRKLVRADVEQVRKQLCDDGFYLQMPPDPATLAALEEALKNLH